MKVLLLLALVGAAAATAPIFTGDVVARHFKEKNIVMKCKDLGLTKTLEMVEMAHLTGVLAKQGPLTLFAPTDDAWNMLPADIMNELKMNITALTMLLNYHTHTGSFLSKMIMDEMTITTMAKMAKIRLNKYEKIVTAEGSPVTIADQMASNGVIHVINRVMWPIPMGDVVDVVSTNANFSTLLTAVRAAGLAQTLKGDAMTVFAPTNDAFAKIPKKALDDLLANKTKLANVLKYHVVLKTWWSSALEDGKTLDTACTMCGGQKLTVNIDHDTGEVKINTNSKVIMKDAAVSNGVIHVVDTVIMPNVD